MLSCCVIGQNKCYRRPSSSTISSTSNLTSKSTNRPILNFTFFKSFPNHVSEQETFDHMIIKSPFYQTWFTICKSSRRMPWIYIYPTNILLNWLFKLSSEGNRTNLTFFQKESENQKTDTPPGMCYNFIRNVFAPIWWKFEIKLNYLI